MIINPTKKAQPIFNKIKQSTDKDDAKSFATANPFFSWHANYINVNRKKLVILINDLTFAVVALYDVNAKNKIELDQRIKEGIYAAFRMQDISAEKVQTYFKLAGDIEINAGFNRRVTSIITNLIVMVDNRFMQIDKSEMLQLSLMDYMMQVPITTSEYSFADDRVHQAFKHNLRIQSVDKKDKKKLAPKKTWSDYHKFDKYAEQFESMMDDPEKYEKIANEIKNNNKLLLKEFGKYLATQDLTDKTIKKHVDRVEFFINGYLVYPTLRTPLAAPDAVEEYLSDWYPRKAANSETDFKANVGSIKRFLKFLEVIGEIDAASLKHGNSELKMGKEIGLEYFDNFMNMSDFW
ncbi:DUF6933 domain-containing protein [Pediococcus argentinicus]|uniref:DUF6933 domain-containing protein n=1 Tax=Pediococcus argentinicus TaxID=480391 RepID=A0A0R2NHF8_9LACO|nr:hypothetical protein [Pediococcus argentinicus]KRO25220.1 hypothetical protein IV88_GL000349 [Pediococcus argentinicus]NKZ22383.1 hypothetical protein [Pediococcus argentinicus]GEP19480.1 hypothetical protein LSA03_08640 [Pediococcus argentinicus]